MDLEITLPPAAAEILHAKVASGEYASVTEALLDALLLLVQRDAKRTRELKLGRLRAALKEGEESGEGIPAEDVLAELDALIGAAPEPA
jgi:antitoxin ParD1/3/4